MDNQRRIDRVTGESALAVFSRTRNGYKLPRIENYEHLFDIMLTERRNRNRDNTIRQV